MTVTSGLIQTWTQNFKGRVVNFHDRLREGRSRVKNRQYLHYIIYMYGRPILAINNMFYLHDANSSQ